MKKILKIISMLIIVLIIVALGYYSYKVNQKHDNNIKNQQPITSKSHDYPELTADVIKEMGGQDVADELIGKFEKATNDLDEAIRKYEDGGKKEEDKPNVVLFAEAGKYAKYVRKYDFAVKILESVFDYYDKSNIALINIAHIYEDKGDYQKAIDTYFRFYKMFPEDNQFQFHTGIIHDYIALGDKEKAVEYYEQYKKAGFTSEEIEQYISNL
jgi:tetratricopeptide (TPR) repeat protein